MKPLLPQHRMQECTLSQLTLNRRYPQDVRKRSPMSHAPSSTPTPASVYQAGAFWPSLGDARIAGTITLHNGQLQFQPSSDTYPAEKSCSLDLATVHLRLGGAHDRILFFSDPAQPDHTLFTSDSSILDHAELRGQPRLAEQIKGVHKKRNLGRAILIGVPVALLLALMILWMARGFFVGAVVQRIPPSLEVRIGELAANQLIAPTRIQDPQVQTMLDALVAPLVAVVDSPYDFTFSVVQDPSVNAFALPGGKTAIHSGLIMKAESANEIYGVLAHEIAHAQRRHTLRNVVSSAGLFLVVQSLLGDLTGIAAVVANGGLNLATLRFSRDFERDADDAGLDLLLAAGIDPHGLPQFLEKLQAIQEDSPLSALPAVDFLSTHPNSTERIQRLEDRLQDAGYGDDLRPEPPPAVRNFNFSAFQRVVREALGAPPQESLPNP